MSAESEAKHTSQTQYRAVAEVVTPIASRTIEGKSWQDQRRSVSEGEVRRSAWEWLQRLERITGRDLQDETVVKVSIETRTIRTITLTDTIKRTSSVLRPYADMYDNQYWKEQDDE